MLFQEISFSQGFLALLLIAILVSIIKFILGTLITRWWAIKYGWDNSYKSSITLNSFWLIIDLLFSIGECSEAYKEGFEETNYKSFLNNEEAAKYIKSII